MFKFINFILLAEILLIGLNDVVIAENDSLNPSLKINGTIQAVGSYAQTSTDTNQVGFGLRRVRVRLTANFSDHIKGFVQYEMTSFSLLDARIEYIFTPKVQIRVGRFVGAGLRAAGLTSHYDIDIIERVNSALIWAKKGIGTDYRDYGAEIIAKTGDFTGRLWVHNGLGSKNIVPSERATATIKNEEFAVTGMGIFMPKSIKGLELGGHIGVGNSNLDRNYIDYSGFIYYEPKPIRLKAEFVTLIENNAKNTVNGPADLIFLGYYLFGAYRVAKNYELLGRFEIVDEDLDINNNEETYFTLGASYSIYPENWKASKITTAYVLHKEGSALPNIANNIFYLMWQIVF
jgi:hypothetical protein